MATMDASKNGYCPIHGAYENKVIQVPGLGEIMGFAKCPACVKTQAEKESRYEKIAKDEQFRSLLSNSAIPKRFKEALFENFNISNKDQRIAFEKAHDFASNFEEAKKKGSFLFFRGTVGTGKTHLACSVGLYVMRNFGANVRYTTVGDMVADIRSTWNSASTETGKSVFNKYANCDLLILDEVGATAGNENEKELLFRILDARYRELKPTVMITNQDDIVPFVGERIWDRLCEVAIPVNCIWDTHRSN